jgi:hypothetical protein
MLKATRTITAPVMWANMHLLFWLSMARSRRPGWASTM